MAPATLLSPMRHTLQLTVTEITRPLNAYRIVQAIFLVPAGYLVDALGPQLCLRVAISVAAVFAPLLPFVTSLSQLMLLQIIFAVTKLFGGLSAMLVITDQAFSDGRNQATATSLLLSGYSFAGFLAPAAIGAMSKTLGWRTSFLILSCTFMVTAVPLTFHFLRQRVPRQPLSVTRHSIVSGMKDLFRKRKLSPAVNGKAGNDGKLFTGPYVTVVAAVAAFSFSMHIVFDHMVLFLNEDFGMGFGRATQYLSAINLIALVSKLAVGPVADRYNKSLLIVLFSCVALVGSGLLLNIAGTGLSIATSEVRIGLFVLLYGIGYAAVFSLTTSILPELGRSNLALRSSCNLMVLFGSGSVGSYLAGAWRSSAGSYKWAWMCNAMAWVGVAGVALFKYMMYDRKDRLATRGDESRSLSGSGKDRSSVAPS